MQFVTEIHYAGRRRFHIEANSAQEAEQLARERHSASRPAGPEDVEEITWTGAARINDPSAPDTTRWAADGAAALELADRFGDFLGADLDEAALRLAEQIGVCPGCGIDVAEAGGNEDCDNADGCGALNGSALIPYEDTSRSE